MSKLEKKPKLYLIGALEKFSFNGLRALLVLFLTRQFFFEDHRAFGVYGSMMSLAFITPLLGGWISDSSFGNRRTLLLGAALAALGTASLLLPWQSAFFVGLGLLVLGSGFIRSNVPALLGKLHRPNESSREAAFTVLYMGYNVGTFLGTLGCAVVGEVYGWKSGFLMAGLAATSSVLLLLHDREGLEADPIPPHLPARVAPAMPVTQLVGLGCVLGGMLIGLLILKAQVMAYLVPVALAASIACMIHIGRTEGRAALSSVVTILVLMAFHMAFFALYEQGSLSLALFTQRNVDRSLAGLIGIKELTVGGVSVREVPVTFFQLIDPALNLSLGSLLAWLWGRSERSRFALDVPQKFAFGLGMMAAGFALLSWNAGAGASAVISPWRLIGAYAVFVVGELCTVPVGMSMVSVRSPRKYATVFMGIWFVSIGASMWVASLLSSLTAGAGARGTDAAASLQIYCGVFKGFSLAALAMALVLLVIKPLLGRSRSAELTPQP